LLGILVATNAALRPLPGPGGFSFIYALPLLGGYVFGAGFGFLLGSLSVLVSAMFTAGVGPWLPFQMFALGWVGVAGAALRVLVGATGSRGLERWLLAAAGFVLMSRWGVDALDSWVSTVPLVLGGLGFGLALAPVNAAALAATSDDSHGLASAMVVVTRMVGMLVGISVLTTLGLRRYYAEQADVPPVMEVCDGRSRCEAFSDLLREAGIAQEHTVFLGAAVCAVVAALTALVVFRSTGLDHSRRYGDSPALLT